MKKIDSKFSKIEIHSPSNIAFIKYWGKYGRQYPMNPSLSMTLSQCKTVTSIEYKWGGQSLEHLETLFEGKPSESFHKRLNKYLFSIRDLYPELNELSLKVSSHNTFPHSAGIASSASAYAAIGLGLSRIISEKRGSNFNILQEASQLARLGSGSASRSIQGPFVRWGEDSPKSGSNEFAEVVSGVHEVFQNMHDCILLVDKEQKSVSSSEGHALMDSHPFKDARNCQANSNFEKMLKALSSGDLETFGEILEGEALTLHALMMSSTPSYILLKPNSLELIARIRDYREKTKTPIYFTIDAGPNIHLLYPDKFKNEVEGFIKSELAPLCAAECLFDFAGKGSIIL